MMAILSETIEKSTGYGYVDDEGGKAGEALVWEKASCH